MLLNKIALQKFCCRGCRVSSLVPGLVYRYSSPSAYIYTVCLQGKQSGQSARIPYLSKSDEIGTEAKLDEIEGQKWKCVLRYTDFYMFDRSRKNQKVRVPEYTFSLLPLSLIRFGFCTNLVRFRFSSLNKVVERTAGVWLSYSQRRWSELLWTCIIERNFKLLWFTARFVLRPPVWFKRPGIWVRGLGFRV